jgi:hypothetical protein
MSHPLDKFIAELRAELSTADVADMLADVHAALEAEADENGDACEFLDGVKWIAKQPVSLMARLDAMTELTSLRGKVKVTLKRRGDRIRVEALQT